MSELNRQKQLTQLNIFLENNSSFGCPKVAGCPQPVLNGNGQMHVLPMDSIAQTIDQSLPLGLQRVRISGGEPFAYPWFEPLLDRLESL
ncbi:MAG: hypothetical protein EHM21_03665, partial [Chloroflexi bacterium]